MAHPTTIHEVCDLRRHDLLAQVERERRLDLVCPRMLAPALPRHWQLLGRMAGILLLLWLVGRAASV